MQEMLFNAHLAYLSNRMYVLRDCAAEVTTQTFFFFRYVFENYTWERTSGDFSSFNGKPIPARVPLTALLSGTAHLLFSSLFRLIDGCYRPYCW
jgi:hypothetical protein